MRRVHYCFIGSSMLIASLGTAQVAEVPPLPPEAAFNDAVGRMAQYKDLALQARAPPAEAFPVPSLTLPQPGGIGGGRTA